MFPLLKLELKTTYCSDHVALLKAFEGWKDAKRNGAERSFCWDNFLSPVTLQMMDDMRMQFLDLLSDIGFVNKSRGPSVSFLSDLFWEGNFVPSKSTLCSTSIISLK